MSALTGALAAVQERIPHVLKGKTANTGTYSYRYADLADVTAAILPLLGANGLAFVTRPTVTDAGGFALEYALRHADGEELTGTYPLPDPVRTPAQQLGSAITYARRYVLCCVTGVVPDEDDDAQAHGDRPAADPPRRRPAELAAEAAERLEAFDGDPAVLDRVLAHAEEHGYAGAPVTITGPDGTTARAPFREAVARKRDELEAAARRQAEAAQDAAETPTPPPIGDRQDDTPEPTAEAPTATQEPAPAPSAADDLLAFAVTIDDADVLRDVYRENRELLEELVALPAGLDGGDLDDPAPLGRVLMLLGKRLADGHGPLERPGPPAGEPWPEQPNDAPPL